MRAIMRKNKKNRSKKGFTLIELIIVIIIIGILAAIAIPQFTSMTKRAHIATVQGTLGALHAGLDLYATNQALTVGVYQYPEKVGVDLSVLLRENYDTNTWNYTTDSGILLYKKITPYWQWTYVSPIVALAHCSDGTDKGETPCGEEGLDWIAEASDPAKYTLTITGGVEGQEAGLQ